MTTAYLDCFSGISGDMFLAALLDAGLCFKELDQALHTLPVTGYRLDIRRELRKGISGTRLLVILEKVGKEPNTLNSIRDIILKSDLDVGVKDTSLKIFELLAEAEAKIHGCSLEEVHFHEVGATDSIIDIVGVAFGIHRLGITKIVASPIPLGSGFQDISHGRIPLPSPATLSLLKGIPVSGSGLQEEMVTPTGAALIKTLVSDFGAMPPMVMEKTGYGVGSRDLSDRPNLLRIIIGNEQVEKETETVVLIETNIDNTNPEWLGYLMDRLFEAGALDVAFFPVQMKKNRPGIQIQVMGRPDQLDNLMDMIFLESATLGIRYRYSQRKILKRYDTNIESPWGKIRVNKIVQSNGISLIMPEYAACREIAIRNRLPLRKIYEWVMGVNKKVAP